jgi:hypothetical protein
METSMLATLKMNQAMKALAEQRFQFFKPKENWDALLAVDKTELAEAAKCRGPSMTLRLHPSPKCLVFRHVGFLHGRQVISHAAVVRAFVSACVLSCVRGRRRRG